MRYRQLRAMRLLLTLALLPAAMSYPRERRRLITTSGPAEAQPDSGPARPTIVLEGSETSDLESSRASSTGGTTGPSKVISESSRPSSTVREKQGQSAFARRWEELSILFSEGAPRYSRQTDAGLELPGALLSSTEEFGAPVINLDGGISSDTTEETTTSESIRKTIPSSTISGANQLATSFSNPENLPFSTPVDVELPTDSLKQLADPKAPVKVTGLAAADSMATRTSATPGKEADLIPASPSTDGIRVGVSERNGERISSPETRTLPSIAAKTTPGVPGAVQAPSRQWDAIKKASEQQDQESPVVSPGQMATSAAIQKPNSQPATVPRPRTGEAAARIITYTAENYQDGYQFQFETTNGIKHEEVGKVFAGTLPGAALMTTEGRVSWTSPEGTQFVMHWHANEHGYQPRGEHIRSKHWHPHSELPPLEQDYPLLKSLRDNTLKLVRFDEEIDESGEVKKTPKKILRDVQEWQQALSRRQGRRGGLLDAGLTGAQ